MPRQQPEERGTEHPTAEPAPCRVVVCRDCCCGTAKVPGVDHGEQLAMSGRERPCTCLGLSRRVRTGQRDRRTALCQRPRRRSPPCLVRPRQRPRRHRRHHRLGEGRWARRCHLPRDPRPLRLRTAPQPTLSTNMWLCHGIPAEARIADTGGDHLPALATQGSHRLWHVLATERGCERWMGVVWVVKRSAFRFPRRLRGGGCPRGVPLGRTEHLPVTRPPRLLPLTVVELHVHRRSSDRLIGADPTDWHSRASDFRT